MVLMASTTLRQTARTSNDSVLYDLRPHQVKALDKLGNGKILWGGVGTGKSRVAAAYYAKNEAPRDIIVITTAKKRDSFDWKEEFYRIGIGPVSGPAIPGRSVRQSSTHGARKQNNLVRGEEDSSSDLGRERSNSDLHEGSSRVRHDSIQDQQNELHRMGGRHDGSDQVSEVGGFGKAGRYPWVLTVDSWNNIAKYADVAGAFFIFDEQRLVGSGNWTRKFLRIAKRNRWILLSGTPGDTWMDYIPVFVANDFYKNRTAFKREHVVYNSFTKFPKVDRYVGIGKLVRLRSQLLVEMPYERHTKRRVIEVPLEFDKDLLETVLKKRWHIYENRPLRDVAEMFSVGRRLVNSDPSRLEMVKELWTRHPKLIIFYNFNYELEILRTLATGFPSRNSSATSSSTTFSTESSLPTGSPQEYFPTSLGPPWDTTSSIVKSGLTELLTSRKSSHIGPPNEPPKGTEKLAKKSGSRGDLAGHTTVSGFAKWDDLKHHGNPAVPSSLTSGPTQSHPVLAEWNGHKHQPIPSGDRWLYLVQYTAGAEGWNCIDTDVIITHSRNYSWKVLEQTRGRIDRLNTPFNDLWYYDFTSESFIDKAIGRALRAKETFNEAKYARLFKGGNQ